MEKEFVTYESAKRLKALGFDEPCIGVYGYNMQEGYPKEIRERLVGIAEISFTEGWPVEPKDLKNSLIGEDISAPTYSQAFRWMREKWGMDHEITYGGIPGKYKAFIDGYIYGDNGNNPSLFTYELAEEACMERLIEIVEKKEIIF
jgi:hypothetical protein